MKPCDPGQSPYPRLSNGSFKEKFGWHCQSESIFVKTNEIECGKATTRSIRYILFYSSFFFLLFYLLLWNVLFYSNFQVGKSNKDLNFKHGGMIKFQLKIMIIYAIIFILSLPIDKFHEGRSILILLNKC